MKIPGTKSKQIAQYGFASQENNLYGGAASRAIDGNTADNWDR